MNDAMKWNKPTTRPNDGQRVIVLNHGGKGAIVGYFYAEYDEVVGVYNSAAWEDVTEWMDKSDDAANAAGE